MGNLAFYVTTKISKANAKIIDSNITEINAVIDVLKIIETLQNIK